MYEYYKTYCKDLVDNGFIEVLLYIGGKTSWSKLASSLWFQIITATWISTKSKPVIITFLVFKFF